MFYQAMFVLCYIMSEQSIEFLLVTIELLSKTILHYITPGSKNHSIVVLNWMCHVDWSGIYGSS